MNVLGICGSYRDDSNTNKIVKLVSESSGFDYELVYLGKTRVKPCTGCLSCAMNEGRCVVDDGMQQLYDKILSADGIVLGSPTYREDVTGAVKCFIDRTIALYYRGIGPDSGVPHTGRRPLAGRPGVAVVTTAAVGADRAAETLKIYFDINRMEVVTVLPEIVRIDDVDDMPEVLARAKEAGKKLGDVLEGQARRGRGT
jgi:multimeric flavodoxin WrbA